MFRIVRGVAKDRIISTVDPEARHGHKSRNRRFDGYKAHLSVDPDSELIDEVVATAANAPDRDAVDDLLADHVIDDKPTVIGDSAYADGATRAHIHDQGFDVIAKCPPVRNSTGGFTKDHFDVNIDDNTVTCPAGHTVTIRSSSGGAAKASFKPHCKHCPLRDQCTPSHRGRTITIHPQEALLQRARAEQSTPQWAASYRADRPLVERKSSSFGARWGGRRARTRGLDVSEPTSTHEPPPSTGPVSPCSVSPTATEAWTLAT